MKRIRTAIHLHTTWSHDSNQTPAVVVEQARREGIDCIAITDHDQIGGALEARDLGGVRVIIGQEVSSRDGHILGLFLHRRIAPGLSAERTIDEIHAQGGLALAPHPFCTLCDHSLGIAIERVAPRLDAVEIHNAQNPLPWQDARAARFARRRGLPAFVGCDGHLRGRLAPAFQTMPDFRTPAEFLASLRDAEFHTARFGPRYFALMGLRHVWDMFMPRRLPGFGVNQPAPHGDAEPESPASPALQPATARPPRR